MWLASACKTREEGDQGSTQPGMKSLQRSNTRLSEALKLARRRGKPFSPSTGLEAEHYLIGLDTFYFAGTQPYSWTSFVILLDILPMALIPTRTLVCSIYQPSRARCAVWQRRKSVSPKIGFLHELNIHHPSLSVCFSQ
jgi:hypothetical protein